MGIESQSHIHYAMSARIQQYDALDYARQLQEIRRKYEGSEETVRRNRAKLSSEEYLSRFSRNDRLIPVFHIILYFGEKPWSAANDIQELMCLKNIPERLKIYLNHYQIQVLDVRRFQNIEQFQTDLKQVFGFIQRDGDRKELLDYMEQNEEYFTNIPADAYDLLAAVSKIKELKKLKRKCKTERGDYNMCRAIQEMKMLSRRQGKREGKREGIRIGEERKTKQFIQNMAREGLSADLITKIAGLSGEEIESMMV